MPMPEEEFNKLEPGDYLHVLVRIEDISDRMTIGFVEVVNWVGRDAGTLEVYPADVVCRVAPPPRALKVGDLVTILVIDASVIYTIVAFDGGTAWLKRDTGYYRSCPVAGLKLWTAGKK